MNTFALIGLLAISIGCVALLLVPLVRKQGNALRRNFRKPTLAVVGGSEHRPIEPASGTGDSASQLRHVMAASFFKKKVMSRDEYKVYKIVETEVRALRNGCRVLSQTSLGEIIGSDSKKAFDSINSKRVDILIMGPYGDPIAAVEYQGAGHHQGTAAARDAIKREALRKAEVHFIEILDDHSPEEIARLIRRVFRSQEGDLPTPRQSVSQV